MATFREEDCILTHVRSECGAVRDTIGELNKIAGILLATNGTLLALLIAKILSKWQSEGKYSNPSLDQFVSSLISNTNFSELALNDFLEFFIIVTLVLSTFFCIELFVVSIRNPYNSIRIIDRILSGADQEIDVPILKSIILRESYRLLQNSTVLAEIQIILLRSLILTFIGIFGIITEFLVILCGTFTIILYVLFIICTMIRLKYLWWKSGKSLQSLKNDLSELSQTMKKLKIL
jgi:preprotein translocase subunit SecG